MARASDGTNVPIIRYQPPLRVKTPPLLTRYRDVEVCKNLVTDEIVDHRIKSALQVHNWTTKIQKERTLHLVLLMSGETEHDTNDNVTTKTQNTLNTAHMDTDTRVRSSLVC